MGGGKSLLKSSSVSNDGEGKPVSAAGNPCIEERSSVTPVEKFPVSNFLKIVPNKKEDDEVSLSTIDEVSNEEEEEEREEEEEERGERLHQGSYETSRSNQLKGQSPNLGKRSELEVEDVKSQPPDGKD